MENFNKDFVNIKVNRLDEDKPQHLVKDSNIWTVMVFQRHSLFIFIMYFQLLFKIMAPYSTSVTLQV